MATIAHGVTNSARLGLSDRIVRAFVAFVAWRHKRAERARILRELAEFDPRDLQDLGISQYDFKAIAEGRMSR